MNETQRNEMVKELMASTTASPEEAKETLAYFDKSVWRLLGAKILLMKMIEHYNKYVVKP